MSLEFKRVGGTDTKRYFLYLKLGKIAKSLFMEHKLLGLIALFLAYRALKKSGVDFKRLRKLGGKLIQMHRRLNAIVVEFKEGLTQEQIDWIRDNLHMEIEPVRQMTACLDNAVKQTGVDAVWKKDGLTGEGITVAVLDTGINDTHPDLQGAIIDRADFTGERPVHSASADSDSKGLLDILFGLFRRKPSGPIKLDPIGHGTHVAGTIGGRGTRYRGAAPKVAMIDVRVLGSRGSGSTDNIIKGMSWASEQGVDIISMSLGGGGNADSAISREADALTKDGILVVVAAGNEGPGPETIGSPGSSEGAITVGAVNRLNKLTSYSSRGYSKHRNGKVVKKPDILAPGGGVKRVDGCPYGNGIISTKSIDTKSGNCTHKDNRNVTYEAMSGTSMATPLVAGSCALLLQAVNLGKDNTNKAAIIKKVIKETATNLGYRDDQQGAGLLNVPAAIEKLRKNYSK